MLYYEVTRETKIVDIYYSVRRSAPVYINMTTPSYFYLNMHHDTMPTFAADQLS